LDIWISYPLTNLRLEIFQQAKKIKSAWNAKCLFVNSSLTPDNVVNITANTGYITAVYDRVWWLAYVTKTMPDSCEVEVSFLVPKGPS